MKYKYLDIILIALILTIPTSISSNIFEHDFEQGFSNQSKTITDHGMILSQELNRKDMGYTVIRLWGSYYEMGYAQAELLGVYMRDGIKDFKRYFGNKQYNEMREKISEVIWKPPEIEDELQGIVDGLNEIYPFENFDILDAKVANAFGDLLYGSACRSHTCWGRYVTDPVKTLSTRRLDWFDFSSRIPHQHHHVLCARQPNDGTSSWVSLTNPGIVLSSTNLNQYGVFIFGHDYSSRDTDNSPGVMPRGVAVRYITTYANNIEESLNIQDIFEEMKQYEIMTGGFINYYAPEGHGGVMAFNPDPPSNYDSDFFDLRLPQDSWHHGEAMITTNAWTNGTYTPGDEDFGADSYYSDDTPKTLLDHWTLLNRFDTGIINQQILSVEYRDYNDMTIWAEGKIGETERTPRLEWEWYDLFNGPTTPKINGPVIVKKNIECDYEFYSIDAQDYDINYIIDWGDEFEYEHIGPKKSGEKVTISHSWNESKTHIIRLKAKNTIDAESDWATLEVRTPKNKVNNTPFLQFLEQHQHLFPMLCQLLELN